MSKLTYKRRVAEMNYCRTLKICVGFLTILILIVVLPELAPAQNPVLKIKVDDAFACPGQLGAKIPVYLTNYEDTVHGFEMWMIMSNPDLAQFVYAVDTSVVTRYWGCDGYDGETCTSYVECTNGWYCTQYYGDICIDSEYTIGYWQCNAMDLGDCLDSTFIPGYDSVSIDSVVALSGGLDTVGTLTGGWELMESRSLAGTGYDLKVTGIADIYWPYEIEGIPPRTEPGTLYNILANVGDIPDTATNRTANINLSGSILDLAPLFSDQYGNLIGMRIDTIPDTAFFRCVAWLPPDNDICLSYQRVSAPPYDSIIVDSIPVTVLDTFKVIIEGGSLTILKCLIGDANGDDQYNLLDILSLIDDIYAKDYAPQDVWKGDFNCDCTVNLLDILSMIDMLYTEPIGEPQPCRYSTWQLGCGQ